MKNIEFSDEIRKAAPGLKVLQVECQVENSDTCDELWGELEKEAEKIASAFRIDEISKREGIAATRAAYKRLGKEPNRYRPSAEALCRRIVNGKGLYRLTTLVDVINLLSVASGYSIGGFDADRIEGDTLTLGAGKEGEAFNAIGRGTLNIAALPIYRDSKGGIGTPTSDEERTKLTSGTRRLLMLVNIYGEELPVAETEALAHRLLTQYASAADIETRLLSVTGD